MTPNSTVYTECLFLALNKLEYNYLNFYDKETAGYSTFHGL